MVKFKNNFGLTVLFQVLDMCAAPGSKTAQLIEMMNEDSDKDLPSTLCYAKNTYFVNIALKSRFFRLKIFEQKLQTIKFQTF